MRKIIIQKSKTADSRTCDYNHVTKSELIKSSIEHISDVKQGMDFFREMLDKAGGLHDFDKISSIDNFYECFQTGFKENRTWLDNHYELNRHHLTESTGTPEDVNLVDVLEYIIDCVMAGKARDTENYYEPKIDSTVLMTAFINTVKLLEDNVGVKQ